jgi:hypothetical protein
MQKLGTYLSAAAVALSLVFVGLEVRNNTIAARSAAMQAISDANSSVLTLISLDERMAGLLVRVFAGETTDSFSPIERQQLNMNIHAYLLGLENTYLQHREGLLPDAIFESYGWNDNLSGTPYFAEFWRESKGTIVSSEFEKFLESRMQIVD